VGAGMYVPAIVTTILILFVLIYFIKFEEHFTGMRLYKGIVLVVNDGPGQVGIIGSLLGDMGVLIKNISLNRLEAGDLLEIELLLSLPSEITIEQVIKQLSSARGMQSIDRLN
jgi:putative Mg2+ transporter-C (MgtC) family protein